MRRILASLILLGCGDGGTTPPECGVAPDAGSGVATITVGTDVYDYSGFHWGKNNDCPATGSAVVSVTIRGNQTGKASGLGLCLPRPDLIASAAIDLGDSTRVQLVGATAVAGACTSTMGPTKPIGTVTFAGFCTEAGTTFAMTLAGQVEGTKTCGTGPSTPVTLVIGGQTLVVAQ